MFHDDLKNLLPLYLSEYKDECVINEANDGAKVKRVIWKNADFQCIDPKIAKDLSGFFEGAKSTDIFKLDCDGAFIVEKKDKAYLFLIELKSSFIPCHIYKASNQIISTYIKLNMILGLLPNYVKDKIIVKGGIFSRPCDEKSLRDRDKSSLLPPNNKYVTETELTRHFVENKGKKMTIKPNRCHKLKNVPLGSNALFKEMELYHIEVPDPNDSITMDASKFI